MQLPNRSAQHLSWRAIPQLSPSRPPAAPQPLPRLSPAAPQADPSCSPGGPGLLLEGSTEDASPSAC